MWIFEWAGEQYLPAIKDASMVYQHIHRYLYASELLKGKRVLDLTIGDGYGSDLLARTAGSVVTLLRDEDNARHAGEKYKRTNLHFIAGQISEISIAEDHSFDAVLCFDAIQNIEDRHRFLSKVKRLMKEPGVFMVSATETEFADEELRTLLSAFFKKVELYGQGTYANSCIWPIAPARDVKSLETVMARNGTDGFELVPPEQRVPKCLIAIASDSLQETRGSFSIFVDAHNELLKDKDQRIQDLTESFQYNAGTLKAYEAQLAERRESLASLREAFAWRESEIKSLTKTREFLEAEIRHFRETIASNDEALAWRASQVEELGNALHQAQDALHQAQNALHQAQEMISRQADQLRLHAQELNSIKSSAGWKLVLRLRSVRNRLLPPDGFGHRLYEKIMERLRER
jgi:ubiquinone/menaquinone biosynthesis C-methylase UbiE